MRNIDSRGKQMRLVLSLSLSLSLLYIIAAANEAQLSVSGTTTNLPQVTPICSHIAAEGKERAKANFSRLVPKGTGQKANCAAAKSR